MGDKVASTDFGKHLELIMDDSADLVAKLARYNYFENAKTLEIKTTLPSAVNGNLAIAAVKRWRELSERYGKPIRVYAYSYNDAVEKLFLRLIQEHDDIYMSVIPGEWRNTFNDA